MAAAGDGSCLPAELLEDVSGRLSADADLLHIHQVCTHWRASTSRLATCRPWIVAGREPFQEIGPIGEYSFWLRSVDREICYDAPADLPYCCGASRGWLALADCGRSPTRLILWEPISKAEILLPPLPAIAQIYLSTEPLTSPSSWTAVASQKTPGPCISQKFFYWRPAGDASDSGWSPLLDYADSRVDSAAFHQGRAYFLYRSWQLHIYDLEASPSTLIQDTFLYLSTVKLFRAPERSRHQTLRTLHIVPCGGECLLVVTYGGRRPPPAEVYRAD